MTTKTMNEQMEEKKYFNDLHLSSIIKDKSGKNCYGEEIEYDILLQSISEKLENLKGFVNGNCIHEFLNIQCIISNQLKRRKFQCIISNQLKRRKSNDGM